MVLAPPVIVLPFVYMNPLEAHSCLPSHDQKRGENSRTQHTHTQTHSYSNENACEQRGSINDVFKGLTVLFVEWLNLCSLKSIGNLKCGGGCAFFIHCNCRIGLLMKYYMTQTDCYLIRFSSQMCKRAIWLDPIFWSEFLLKGFVKLRMVAVNVKTSINGSEFP